MEELEEKWERAFPLISFFFFEGNVFLLIILFIYSKLSQSLSGNWAEDVMRTDIISHIWYLFFDWQQ